MARRKHHLRARKTGLPPGTPVYVGNQPEGRPHISVYRFDEESIEQVEVPDVSALRTIERDGQRLWINVTGLHDVEAILEIGRLFGIHSLVLEDIVNTEQRPKAELFDDQVFLSMKMVLGWPEDSPELDLEQVSLVLGQGWLISFQEREGDVFGPVRERLDKPGSRLRQPGLDYLLYSLVDLVTDRYLAMLEQMGDELDAIEEEILAGKTEPALHRLQLRKRQLHQMRRIASPLREAVGLLYRDDTPLVSEATRRYVSDLYDHLIQVQELLESLRELCVELRETHLALLGNRTNEVMKVLTIIATIFIPLTFIVGIYGMNFRVMPELEWRFGYLAIWLVMLALTLGMVRFFRRRGWF